MFLLLRVRTWIFRWCWLCDRFSSLSLFFGSMVLGVRESNAIDKKPRYDCGRRDSRIKYRYDTMTRCLRVDPERESEQETRHQQVPITVFDVSFIILPSTNVVDDISIYIYPYSLYTLQTSFDFFFFSLSQHEYRWVSWSSMSSFSYDDSNKKS